jgi:hypothetical protein
MGVEITRIRQEIAIYNSFYEENPMGRIDIAFAIIFTMTLLKAQGEKIGAEAEDARLEQRTWPAVSNGLVFVEGEFLPPPYTVSRVRNEIYINGKFMDAPSPWPKKKDINSTKITPPIVDPDIPHDLNEQTTMYDDVYIRYIYEKRRYLFNKHGQDKGIDMMVDVYTSLPCIKSARRVDDSTSISIIWKSGEIDRVRQVPPKRKDISKEQVIMMSDNLCETYVQDLNHNDYFMFGNPYRTGIQDGYGQFLVPIAEALKTSKDEETFVTVMTNKFPMITGFTEKAFRSFYKHKDQLPQWEPLLQKRCKGRQ